VPPSLQFEKTYLVPVDPWGVVVAMVCELPVVHEKVCEELYVTPSTEKLRPVGLVVIVMPLVAEKLAVTLLAADIVTDCGLVAPVRSPDQEENM
jgi:hypothetical protein